MRRREFITLTRRYGGGLAARGARAAVSESPADRVPVLRLFRTFAGSRRLPSRVA